ncbi:MAG: glycosyltransferase [Thermodesulfobacteriota bacterium]
MKIALSIPTLNGGETFERVVYALSTQTIRPENFLVIDSGSTDNTVDAALAGGAKIYKIRKEDFNHGGTRNMAWHLVEADVYIFMTQDALPADPHTMKNLLRPFSMYPKVGVVYARQLPRPRAGPIEALSRFFTYPASSQLKKISDKSHSGIKTVYCSNACAAYRREALASVEGFPENVIMCEDVYTAARIMEAGYDIYYQADSLVYHSHDYSILQEFKRYFDLGVFYESRERWIIDAFGGVKQQGMRFFLEGLGYLKEKECQYLFPEFLVRTAAKLCGYKLGSIERYLPKQIKTSISMHENYWRQVEGL